MILVIIGTWKGPPYQVRECLMPQNIVEKRAVAECSTLESAMAAGRLLGDELWVDGVKILTLKEDEDLQWMFARMLENIQKSPRSTRKGKSV